MDPVNQIINGIIYGNMSFDAKIKALCDIEPYIEQHYRSGLTTVKPVFLLTVDDLLTL